MVTRADIGGTRPVTPVAAIRITPSINDASQEAFDRLSKFPVGKLLQAQVLSRLNDGAFMVKVSDLPMRLNLPAGTQPGDVVELTLVATHPRPAFSLSASAGNAAGASLSNAARLIGQALQTAQDDGAPATLVGKAPLVSSPAASPVQVATALKNTLTFSGLFYESHLYQWASGNRPLAELMREPQAQHSHRALLAALRNGTSADPTQLGGKAALNTAAFQAGPHGLNGSDPDPLLQHARQLPGGAQILPAPGDSPFTKTASAEAPPSHAPTPEETAQTNKGAVAPDAKTLASGRQNEMLTQSLLAVTHAGEEQQVDPKTAARPETLGNEAARMIGLQLDTLEHRHVAWQGELWPGQRMEWEVTEDTPKNETGETEMSWQSVVRFELPTLGTISASIRLTGDRLQVHVRTSDEVSASLLRAHGGELASALEASGSALEQLTVKRDEPI